MDIADKIIEALREKYRPLGIAVYGSFADGSNNRNSDFDALLLLPDGETGHDDSVLFGTELGRLGSTARRISPRRMTRRIFCAP